MKLLFISTPVGAFGSGIGGGVELTIQNVATELKRRSHIVHLAGCVGSYSDSIPLITVPGEVHSFAQNQTRHDPVSFPDNSVLANLWDYARQVQGSYDLIVNFAYDWLPFYLTPFFSTAIAHFVSMGSLLDNIDRLVHQVASTHKGTVGVYTKAQAYTFGTAVDFRVLGSGVDLAAYRFEDKFADEFWAQAPLAWVGRIAPEKGLEDAAALSQLLQVPVHVMGKMQDESYWQQIHQDYPHAQLQYLGFHPTFKLQALLGQCRALVMTPKWEEAFGNVAIEALACGVPVISYARGGLVEIIHHHETGFLVEPDNIEALCGAVNSLSRINRHNCRRQAEREFSLAALGDRFENWFTDIVKGYSAS